MNSCLWGAVRFDKDGGQTQRVLRNMDVELIQEVCTTVRNQVQSLQEGELFGLQDQLDWTRKPMGVVFFA